MWYYMIPVTKHFLFNRFSFDSAFPFVSKFLVNQPYIHRSFKAPGMPHYSLQASDKKAAGDAPICFNSGEIPNYYINPFPTELEN